MKFTQRELRIIQGSLNLFQETPDEDIGTEIHKIVGGDSTRQIEFTRLYKKLKSLSGEK